MSAKRYKSKHDDQLLRFFCWLMRCLVFASAMALSLLGRCFNHLSIVIILLKVKKSIGQKEKIEKFFCNDIIKEPLIK